MTSETVETSDRPRILVVDDTPDILRVLGDMLTPWYDVQVAKTGQRALEIVARGAHPDLILLDVMMPGMSGYDVLERLKGDPATREIPVVFLTAMNSTADEEKALERGAVDYITKPIRRPIVLARVRGQIDRKRARDVLQDQNAFLEREVARRMAESQLVQDATVRALGRLAEIHDPETGNHIHRTREYVRTLALQLRKNPRFAAVLTDGTIALMAKCAPLHDIGKVGIPDYILQKPGRLTPDEWEIMKTHARIGADAIEEAERDLEQPLRFLTLAKEIAHWHHEKWDGSGYPDALRGDEIPLSARLMALSDVFDALISSRVYKPAYRCETARQIIIEGRGTHFDPDVVDAFLETYDTFVMLARRYGEASA